MLAYLGPDVAYCIFRRSTVYVITQGAVSGDVGGDAICSR